MTQETELVNKVDRNGIRWIRLDFPLIDRKAKWKLFLVGTAVTLGTFYALKSIWHLWYWFVLFYLISFFVVVLDINFGSRMGRVIFNSNAGGMSIMTTEDDNVTARQEFFTIEEVEKIRYQTMRRVIIVVLKNGKKKKLYASESAPHELMLELLDTVEEELGIRWERER